MTTKETREMAEKAHEALKKAVSEALERKRRLGQYAVVNRDDKPFHLPPADDTRIQEHGTD
jgi:hypothetical protein